MQSTTHSSPWRRLISGYVWPESTRQTVRGPPSRRATSINCASRSTARFRASGSGFVKSGEQQSIGMAKPAAAMASPTRSRYDGLETGEEPVVHLQAVGVERSRHLDPVEDRHRSLACDLVDITLGKSRDLQRHACVSSIGNGCSVERVVESGLGRLRCAANVAIEAIATDFFSTAPDHWRRNRGICGFLRRRFSLTGHGRPRAFLMMFEIARAHASERCAELALTSRVCSGLCSLVLSDAERLRPKSASRRRESHRPHHTPGPICPPATKWFRRGRRVPRISRGELWRESRSVPPTRSGPSTGGRCPSRSTPPTANWCVPGARANFASRTRCASTARGTSGWSTAVCMCVRKFTPDGKLLLTLGTPGRARRRLHASEPSDGCGDHKRRRSFCHRRLRQQPGRPFRSSTDSLSRTWGSLGSWSRTVQLAAFDCARFSGPAFRGGPK